MTVVWAPPENDGGKSITGYILERKEKRAVRWVPCTKSPISERRMKVTNLIPNHEYQFRVKAENEVGLGEPSKPCRPVAAKDPIGEIVFTLSVHFFQTSVQDRKHVNPALLEMDLQVLLSVSSGLNPCLSVTTCRTPWPPCRLESW